MVKVMKIPIGVKITNHHVEVKFDMTSHESERYAHSKRTPNLFNTAGFQLVPRPVFLAVRYKVNMCWPRPVDNKH